MENARAKELLLAERRGLETLLEEAEAAGAADRTAANQDGDMFDSAQPLTEQGTDESVMDGIRDRLAAVERAETRLEEGTYGISVQSGLPIPDDRLEADPAAELTVDEAAQQDDPPAL
jgi:DnaK suppressor protein